MTEVPSRGLLPQLTDVLHALTDSQELLLCKLRSVTLGHEAASPWADEHETPHAEFLDVVDRRPSAVVEPLAATASLALEAVSLPQVGNAYLTRTHRPTLVDTSAIAHATKDQVRISAPEDVHRRGLSRPDTPHNAAPAEGESSNRNYNYFDELDARLAHLGKTDPNEVNPPQSGLLSSHDRS